MEGVMPLSQAIRLGSMLKPQVFGILRNRWGTCALGAAREAVGVRTRASVKLPWGWIEQESECPSCADEMSVDWIITHLNDNHRWTRERIADWVATVEPKQESTTLPSFQPEQVSVAV
jgi:hypothetical protein